MLHPGLALSFAISVTQNLGFHELAVLATNLASFVHDVNMLPFTESTWIFLGISWTQ